MLDEIEYLVRCESPSSDRVAVARSADAVSVVGISHLGFSPERIVLDGRTHLLWRTGKRPRVLILGHHDTVWPIGSLETHPFEIAGDKMRGPGCFDMKAGIVMAFHAMSRLGDHDGIAVLITGDEELGSPTSRALIEEHARGCRAALVLEAAGPGGALKTERKGVSQYNVRIHGRAAHAGLEPERGVNATVEAAHQVLTIASWGTADTTVTPTKLEAGTTRNTVPAEAWFSVDVRVRDAEAQSRIDASMRSLRPVLAGSRLDLDGGPNRPPLSRRASAELFAVAARLADDLGLGPLSEIAVGGGSDGNLTAGIGTPTLDGLGAIGGGAHADDEHVLVGALPARVSLLTALIASQLSAHT
ncbi:M20 family metallopeptidase [Jatrophihabitans sp. DSM 45814]